MTANEQIAYGLAQVNSLVAMTEYENGGADYKGTHTPWQGAEKFIPKDSKYDYLFKSYEGFRFVECPEIQKNPAVRFAVFNTDGHTLKTLYETNDPNDTLAKIFAEILSDNSLSDEHKTALIELMRVAYVTLTAESNLTKK